MNAFTLTAVVFLTLLPGLAWLFFFLHEDIHPEPKRLIAYTFGFGVLASIPVFAFQIVGQSLIAKISAGLPLTILFLALVEEIFKFIAAYWAVGKSPEMDEPIDAMVYMIVAALGLATIENFFIIAGFLKTGGYQIFSDLTSVVVLRFVGATLLHALSSGLLGFYWAKGKMRKEIKKYIFVGLCVATLVHFVFNYLILIFQNLDLLLYPSLFLIGSAFFLFKDFQKLRLKS